ncbi:MAG: DUF169 domain-containing protein [Acidimicrobiales bacterium]
MTGSAKTADWRGCARRLSEALHLSVPPIYLAFSDEPAPSLEPFAGSLGEPAAGGRTGSVAASCVFWVKAAEQPAFSTVAEDHGNCSVGRLTHGFATLEEVAGNDDVGALLSSGWVTEEMVGQIPAVTDRPGSIGYGRLEDVPDEVRPDVVLLRVNARQMMVLSDAIPAMSIQGKPQCHIVALARDRGEAAASVGCALSRARTGMRPDEMTCALPGGELASLVEAVETAARVDSEIGRYAAADARRFS